VLARRHDQRPARRCTTTGRGWPPAPQGQSCADDRSRRSASPALATFASADPICLLAAAIRTAIGCQRLGCSSSPLRAGVTGVSPFFFRAVAQAREEVPNKAAATALIMVGLFVEVVKSAGVVSGIADRACAFVLAGYCAVTALVWKQFWRPGDFWSSSKGKARAVLGFLEELGFGRWLSSHRLRDRCVVDRSVLRPSDDPIPRLPTDAGARAAVSTETSPVVPYWHIWTDADGISHQSRCEMAEFHKAPIQPEASPQWIGAQTRHDATVFVTVLPVGWIGEWHENPRPQWIIPLSSR
jgi:uncharacterized membrane protein YphA (DoxX/SURF4 family)